MAQPIYNIYVLGFLFNRDRTQVVLIHKKHPAWQEGFLNGIGGRVEPGELPHTTMSREFREEAGLWVPEDLWEWFAVMRREFKTPQFLCHCFRAVLPRDDLQPIIQSTTDEPVVCLSIADLPMANCLSSVPWLVLMAADVCVADGNLYEVSGVMGSRLYGNLASPGDGGNPQSEGSPS